MKSVPRILPIVGAAVVGVLAINALSGARALPDLLTGARALAEDVAKPGKAKPGKADKAGKSKPTEGVPVTAAAAGEAKDAAAHAAAAGPRLQPVCAPTAAELAKEAGLSPAELQVLQSLGARRGQLDQREKSLDVQLALLAAAEAKLDAKVKALNGLKTDINGLLAQADSRDQAEIDRMVKVFEGMKPKDAAPRLVVLDDSVRLPIAAKMKERALSAVLAAMAPGEAKKLTEALARRYAAAKNMAAAASAQPASAQPAAKPAPLAEAAPAKPKPAPRPPRPKTAEKAKPDQTAAAEPAAKPPTASPTAASPKAG